MCLYHSISSLIDLLQSHMYLDTLNLEPKTQLSAEFRYGVAGMA